MRSRPRNCEGWIPFFNASCTTCHNGPLLGGNSYQKSGLIKPYVNQADVGRAAVTKDDDDKFKFKVPSLRNIAVTHPYFHDGKVSSLHEAVRQMAAMQLGMELTKEQEADLVAFLKALTGKELQNASHGAQPERRKAIVTATGRETAGRRISGGAKIYATQTNCHCHCRRGGSWRFLCGPSAAAR